MEKGAAGAMRTPAVPRRSPTFPYASAPSSRLTHERMVQERVNDDGHADNAWHNPKRPLREFFPQRQTLSVVDVKSGQQQDIGKPHSCEMMPDPTVPVV